MLRHPPGKSGQYDFTTTTVIGQPAVSEVESQLRGQGPRGYVVGAAEGGEEVVERVVVRQVDDG